MLFNNYQPVSLLCVLSKVFEKVMHDRIILFLENFKIFNENQNGFRKKKSTYMALLSLMENLTQALEKGEYAVGVFLDFSKVFDTVDHETLLDKLEHYGIRGCALSLGAVLYHGSKATWVIGNNLWHIMNLNQKTVYQMRCTTRVHTGPLTFSDIY